MAYSVPRVRCRFSQLELNVGPMWTHGMMPLEENQMVGGVSG